MAETTMLGRSGVLAAIEAELVSLFASGRRRH
jgi:hypothetical protein